MVSDLIERLLAGDFVEAICLLSDVLDAVVREEEGGVASTKGTEAKAPCIFKLQDNAGPILPGVEVARADEPVHGL